MTVYYIWPQISSGINYGDIFVISSVKVTRVLKKIIVKKILQSIYIIFLQISMMKGLPYMLTDLKQLKRT